MKEYIASVNVGDENIRINYAAVLIEFANEH